MSKEQEIQVLQSLKGDTYFAQFFGGLDIDLMCENIKNDFAIESGCHFNQKASLLEKEKQEQALHYIERQETLVRAIIDDCEGVLSEIMYKTLVEQVGKLFIIKYKHSKGYELIRSEIDYLVEFMDKKLNG